MKTEKVDVTVRIQNSQMIKQGIIELEDTLEDIPPQALNPLVVNTSSNNHAFPTWSSKWMLQHVHCNLCVFSSLEMEGHILSQLCGIYQGQRLLCYQWHSSDTQLAGRIHLLPHVQPFSTYGRTHTYHLIYPHTL